MERRERSIQGFLAPVERVERSVGICAVVKSPSIEKVHVDVPHVPHVPLAVSCPANATLSLHQPSTERSRTGRTPESITDNRSAFVSDIRP